MWSVWDKQSEINGYPAEHYFKTFRHLVGEEVIYIKTANGRVTQVEGKSILANNYDLDPTLPDDEFLAAYEAKLAELEAEIPPPEEIPEEIPEEEETDTTTYAELAQVYAEGVNSIE